MKRFSVVFFFRAFGVFLLILCLSSVSGAMNVYTDRGSWELSAGGAPDIFENFNSINTDTPLPISLGVFNLSTTGPDAIIDSFPFIDPPDGVVDDFVVDGTTYFRAPTNNQNISNEAITITFNFPVSTWGVDLNPHSGDLGDKMDITTNTGETGIWTLPFTDSNEFRGLVADNPFSSITFSFNATSDGDWSEAGWDNVGAHTIPIPAAVWLLGSGLVGLVALRRKFQK